MKILRIAALFFVVTLLFCCATVQPVYIGKDTYMIAKGAST